MTITYQVTVTIDSDGDAIAYVTSAAGDVGSCEVGFDGDNHLAMGHCDLGAIILSDALAVSK